MFGMQRLNAALVCSFLYMSILLLVYTMREVECDLSKNVTCGDNSWLTLRTLTALSKSPVVSFCI